MKRLVWRGFSRSCDLEEEGVVRGSYGHRYGSRTDAFRHEVTKVGHEELAALVRLRSVLPEVSWRSDNHGLQVGNCEADTKKRPGPVRAGLRVFVSKKKRRHCCLRLVGIVGCLGRNSDQIVELVCEGFFRRGADELFRDFTIAEE